MIKIMKMLSILYFFEKIEKCKYGLGGRNNRIRDQIAKALFVINHLDCSASVLICSDVYVYLWTFLSILVWFRFYFFTPKVETNDVILVRLRMEFEMKLKDRFGNGFRVEELLRNVCCIAKCLLLLSENCVANLWKKWLK